MSCTVVDWTTADSYNNALLYLATLNEGTITIEWSPMQVGTASVGLGPENDTTGLDSSPVATNFP